MTFVDLLKVIHELKKDLSSSYIKLTLFPIHDTRSPDRQIDEMEIRHTLDIIQNIDERIYSALQLKIKYEIFETELSLKYQ